MLIGEDTLMAAWASAIALDEAVGSAARAGASRADGVSVLSRCRRGQDCPPTLWHCSDGRDRGRPFQPFFFFEIAVQDADENNSIQRMKCCDEVSVLEWGARRYRPWPDACVEIPANGLKEFDYKRAAGGGASAQLDMGCASFRCSSWSRGWSSIGTIQWCRGVCRGSWRMPRTMAWLGCVRW